MTSLMNKLNPDILMIQETHIRKSLKLILNTKRSPFQYHATGSSKSRGNSILINRNVQFQALDIKVDKRGRFIFVKDKLESELIMLVYFYAPNDGQISFLDSFLGGIDFSQRKKTLIVRDFSYITDIS